MIEKKFYSGFLEYYDKAKYLQEHCNLGESSYLADHVTEYVDDPLMQNVDIYDCVERKYAGFSNMLQDLWLSGENPKIHHQDFLHRQRTEGYKDLHNKWSMKEWLYVFLFHRITGSGASFEADHGYRNSIVPSLATFGSVPRMTEYVSAYTQPFFTSIGNQPPQTDNRKYLVELAPKLIDDLLVELEERENPSIRELATFCNLWNKERDINRFTFIFTAFCMDISDYYPEIVDEESKIFYGSNATKCSKLLFEKERGTNQLDFMDRVSTKIQEDTGGFPKDTEDVMCDFVRYVNNYIPKSTMGTHSEHIGNITNNSKIDRDELPNWAKKYGNK